MQSFYATKRQQVKGDSGWTVLSETFNYEIKMNGELVARTHTQRVAPRNCENLLFAIDLVKNLIIFHIE